MRPEALARLAAASCATLAGVLCVAGNAGAQVAVTVNGDQVNFYPAPIVQAGRVFVPLRGVFERLGASVVYSNGTINATGNGRDISLAIGSTQATVNGQPETIDVAPFIIGASTFVPLRFVSEALGASVNWDNTDDAVSIATVGTPPQYVAPVDQAYAYSPPPPLPAYVQPDVPAPDEIWQPGYWAWGPYGYYWIPGTWVAAPEPGYLWTPGYWQDNGGTYAFIAGYWALAVGFYGGVNYGGGYFGNGYSGGRWADNAFQYNTYVTRVDTTIVHNTYVDRNVRIVNSTTRVSYSGGNGLRVRPTAQQAALASQSHLPMTAAQRQHVQAAAQDRRLLAKVNHAHPSLLTVARPLTADEHPEGFVPVTPTDRTPIKPRPAPAVRAPAPVPAAHVAAPPAPIVHPAPTVRAVPVAPRPVVRPVPAAPHPRVVRPAPVAPHPARHAPAHPEPSEHPKP